LLTQRSPEIPVAVAAADLLRALVRGLACDCAGLAGQCEAYADAVEVKHAQVRALLREVLALVVEGVVIAAALAAVTAGVAAAGGTAAIAARVATTAPRFHALLLALRATTAGLTTSLRSAHAALATRRAQLDRFLRLPPRTERGAIGPLLRPRRGPGWLVAHERSGGHTLSKHVGRTPEELALRFKERRRPEFASTFDDVASAERLLDRVLNREARHVEEWARGNSPRLLLETTLGERTGISMTRSGDLLEARGVTVVLVRDAGMPDGYRILTAFPKP
jgi:hypothetical protein